MADEELEFFVAESLKSFIVIFYHDALCGLSQSQRLQLEAGVDGTDGLVGSHFVCLLVPEPFDAPLLEQEPLLAEPLSVLLYPLQVLPLSLLTGLPIDLGDALLPAVAGGPVLEGTQRGGAPQSGPTRVGTKDCRQFDQASIRSQTEVDGEGPLLAGRCGHVYAPSMNF
jgi:hypothetical protein